MTPYQFASNKPIWAIDLDGMEAWELTNRTELKQEGEKAINYDPIRDAIRRDIYNPLILKPDMHNVTVIGRKSTVERNIASVKIQHDKALGEQIASGPGAAIGYLGWGEKGVAVGAAFDQVMFSFTGVPEQNGYLSKPQSKKWAEWVPNTEQVIKSQNVNSKTAETNTTTEKPEPINDLVGFRRDHILNRHKSGAGKQGKTEFPSSWSNQKIIDEVNKIANDPNAAGGIGQYNSPYKYGTVDGVVIRVDFYPIGHSQHAGKVSTAYPINTMPKN